MLYMKNVPNRARALRLRDGDPRAIREPLLREYLAR
jgi:hypothetical protein